MGANFKMLVKKSGDLAHVSVSGHMDENAVFEKLDFSGAKKAVFEFEKLSQINSAGIQRWVQFFRGLPADLTVTFEKCSLNVIKQMIMFPAFTAGRAVKVTSFFAPYFDEDKDEAVELLIDMQKDFTSNDIKHMPDRSNAKGEAMIFDGLEKTYAQFVKTYR